MHYIYCGEKVGCQRPFSRTYTSIRADGVGMWELRMIQNLQIEYVCRFFRMEIKCIVY